MICIIEDDNSIRELMRYTLTHAGYQVADFSDGESFFAAFQPEDTQLLLLDIMLPGEDGLSILQRLRQDARSEALPVILVTARGTEYDKVKGLDLGADDYLAKPFGMLELLARVRAMLRRSERGARTDCLRRGPIALDLPRHRVTVDGAEIHRTGKEFDLLALLLRSDGAAVSREEILEQVWQVQSGLELETRTVDVHIRTLRQKLGAGGALIETVRGIGYRLGDAT